MRFGFLSLPVGFAYMLALYPLDRRATLIKLVGEDKANEALEAIHTGAPRSFWRRHYGGAGFFYYCAQCLVEISVSTVCTALLEAVIQVAEPQVSL